MWYADLRPSVTYVQLYREEIPKINYSDLEMEFDDILFRVLLGKLDPMFEKMRRESGYIFLRYYFLWRWSNERYYQQNLKIH